MRTLQITDELQQAIDGAVLAATVLQRTVNKALLVQRESAQPAQGTGLPAVGETVAIACEIADVGTVFQQARVSDHGFLVNEIEDSPGDPGSFGPFAVSDEGKTWRRVQQAEPAQPSEHIEDAVGYSLLKPSEPAKCCPGCGHAPHRLLGCGECGRTGGACTASSEPEKAESLPGGKPTKPMGVRAAIDRAVRLFAGEGVDPNGTFNLANLSHALMEQAGLRGVVDGRLCRVILAGRDDVEQLSPGDAHYRLKASSEPAGEVTTESLDPSAGCRNCMRSLERPEDMPSDGGVCLGCAEIPRKDTVTDFQITTKNLENEAGTQLGFENEEALTSCDRAMIEAAKRDIRANIARATAADRATIAELQDHITCLQGDVIKLRQVLALKEKYIRAVDQTAQSNGTKIHNLTTERDRLRQQHEADAARVRELEAELERVRTLGKEHAQKWLDACKERDAARAELETVKAKLVRESAELERRDKQLSEADVRFFKAIEELEQAKKCFELAVAAIPQRERKNLVEMARAELATDHEQPVAPARPGDENHCTCGMPLTPREHCKHCGGRLCVDCCDAAQEAAERAERPAAADGETIDPDKWRKALDDANAAKGES